MGKAIWTVSSATLLLTAISGCSKAGLSWDLSGLEQEHVTLPSLSVSGPLAVAVNASCSSAFSISLVDSQGAPAEAPSEMEVALTGSGTANFYDNATCSGAVSSLRIPKGAQNATFYVLNSSLGLHDIRANTPDVAEAKHDYQVDPAPVVTALLRQVAATGHPRGACVEYEFVFQDSTGRQTPLTSNASIELDLIQNGDGNPPVPTFELFGESLCITPLTLDAIQNATFSPSIGMNRQPFWVRVTDTVTYQLSPVAFSPAMASNNITFTPSAPGAVAQVKFAPHPAHQQLGQCTAFTVYTADAAGNAVVNGSVFRIQVTGTPLIYDSLGNCTSNGPTLAAPFPDAGSSGNAEFYVKTATRGDLTLIADPVPVGFANATTTARFFNKVSQMASGSDHTCALTEAGRVWCWGLNSFGQANPSAVGMISGVAPNEIPLGLLAKMVAAGNRFSCAIVEDVAPVRDKVVCWGGNSSGEIPGAGAGSFNSPTTVYDPGAGGSLILLALGDRHGCVLKGDANQTVACWGNNAFGETGDAATLGGVTATVTPAMISVTQVSASGHNTCVKLSTNDIQCWGMNGMGQLGASPMTTPFSAVPHNVGGAQTALGLGLAHTCTSAGQVTTCRGRNQFGELASFTNYTLAVANSAPLITMLDRKLEGGRSITGGDGFTCVVQEGGMGVLCFGKNSSGQLGGAGAGGPTPRLLPIHVVPTFGLSAGANHVCAAMQDGRASCWGAFIGGQLGIPYGGNAIPNPRTFEL